MSLPVHEFRWNIRGYSRSRVDELWCDRVRFMRPYRLMCARPPCRLRVNPAIWANVLERATRGFLVEFRGPGLLPASLAETIDKAHQRLVGDDVSRPQTVDELRSNATESEAAQRWAAEVFQREDLSAQFTKWVPELADAATGDSAAVARARDRLVRCCWPVQITLSQQALRRLYEEMVGPLTPPFIPFVKFLPTCGIKTSEEVATRLVHRWWEARFSRVPFRFADIRSELRGAREV